MAYQSKGKCRAEVIIANDFLNKLLELASDEIGYDVKKNFSSKLSNGTESDEGNTTTK